MFCPMLITMADAQQDIPGPQLAPPFDPDQCRMAGAQVIPELTPLDLRVPGASPPRRWPLVLGIVVVLLVVAATLAVVFFR